MKGAVAAGHELTARAAIEILQDGGNAFDAVIAAHLAACVAEPVLSSLGGGGFMMAKPAKGQALLYDFFVQTPIQKANKEKHDFFPIEADFGETGQTFYIGSASMATPGTVKGLFTIHRDLCTMPMKRLAEPAIHMARNGVAVNEFQSAVLDIIEPIYRSNEAVKELYKSSLEPGHLLRPGDKFQNKKFADFLDSLAGDGEDTFYLGEFAEKTAQICYENGGILTQKDFSSYRVIKRKPIKESYRGEVLYLNPPPSSGGSMILFALKLMEKMTGQPLERQKPDQQYIRTLAEAQFAAETARLAALANDELVEFADLFGDTSLFRQAIGAMQKRLNVSRGTTHISVIDGDGNMASLTTSNGEGSGLLIPGTGIMMNNMLGEEDLNPAALFEWQQNRRMTSMMAPGMLMKKDGTEYVFGSGGSSRIRTAILQLIVNLVDYNMTIESAVSAPRIHAENEHLNIEPGFPLDIEEILLKEYPKSKRWESKSLFFGGTHVVFKKGDLIGGAGDPRRGGVYIGF